MSVAGRLVLAGVLVLLLALQPAQALRSPASAQAPADFEPGEILVKFKPGASGQAVADAYRQNGLREKGNIPGIDVKVLSVPAGRERALVAALEHNPNVQFAEVNGRYEAVTHTGYPNDQRFHDQWQYRNTGQNGGTADKDMDAFEAWTKAGGTQGDADGPIAILDTGIDRSHEDLRGGSTNKVIADQTFTSSSSTEDKYGHGTHVAGSAGSKTSNTIGVSGTCPGCPLLNVKVLSDSGSGNWSWIANGILWAANCGSNPCGDPRARVINMSLGGSSGSSTVEAAVNKAWDNGVVVVAAAGNNGTSSKFYPAAYEKVIAVAATDRHDNKASFSNYGAEWVDVAAPGVDILSTAPDHNNRIWTRGVKYGTISGTSMASPHVAGVAGLVWSEGTCGTGSTASESQCVRDLIEDTAETIDGTGSSWAHGRINACRAVGISASDCDP